MSTSVLAPLAVLLLAACAPSVSDEPSGRAIDDLPEVGPTLVEAADLGEDDLIKNRLEVVFRSDATTAGLDAALASVGGSLAAARTGLPYVTVTIPAAADLAAVQAQAEALRAHPDIVYAGPAWLTSPPEPISDERLPLAPPGLGGAENTYLGEQRFFGAWNATALASHRTTVVVADFYTRPEPLPQLSVQRFLGVPTVEDPVLEENRTNFRGNHGFWVTSLLAADADAVAPSGTHPRPEDTLDVASLQLIRVGSPTDVVLYMDRFLPTDAPFVLNTSFGFADRATASERAMAALAWREVLIRRQQPFLQLTTSGNGGFQDTVATYANSIFSMQAALDDLLVGLASADQALFAPLWEDANTRLGARARARQGHTLIVGASTPQGEESEFSNRGADVRMTGEYLLGVCDRPAGTCGADGLQRGDGTSGASPLAAGLAAWLLAIDPTLEPRDLSDLLVDAFDGRWVDALTATLALEARGVPVRRALLDVDQSGAFDEADITSLLATFDANEAARASANPEDRSWGRADLNGDGHARSDTFAPFDLNGDGQLADVTVQVPGAEAAETTERTLDERALSDLDALCWGAFAGPFTGDTDARDDALRGPCQPSLGREGTIHSTLHLVCPHGERTTSYTATVRVDPEGTVVSVSGNGVQTGSFANVSPGDCVSHEDFRGPLVLEADGDRSSLFEGEGGVGNLNLLYLGGGTTTFTGLDNCSGPQVDEVETQTVNFSFQRTPDGFYDFTRSNVRPGDCEETLEVTGVLR